MNIKTRQNKICRVLLYSNRNFILNLILVHIEVSSCVGEHKFKPVLLIYAACACVVVNRYNIDFGVERFYGLHHTFTHDVVGQTTERLGANDVFCARFGKLQHFCREKPTLAHLNCSADDAFAELGYMVEMRPRLKRAVLAYSVAYILLFLAKEVIHKLIKRVHFCVFLVNSVFRK